jgi:menaquinone-9 beta-reductase
MLISGVLFDAMPSVPADTNHWIMTPDSGHFVFVAPQRDGRARAYTWHPRERGDRLQGPGDLPRFVEESMKAGAPREWYSGARAIGPLATFDGTDNWVNHPYKAGMALIGDAAASSDPSYGQGQCLSVMDARVLRDHLLANDDWDLAGHAYANEHDHYFGAVHTFTG